MTDIKPCPFCGIGIATARGRHIGVTWKRYECLNCGALGPEREDINTRPENAWNTRPIEDALRARVEDLEGKLLGTQLDLGYAESKLSDAETDVDALKAENTDLRARIAELEAQLTAVPQWTCITEDPATWPQVGKMLIMWNMQSEPFEYPAYITTGGMFLEVPRDSYWLPIIPPEQPS